MGTRGSLPPTAWDDGITDVGQLSLLYVFLLKQQNLETLLTCTSQVCHGSLSSIEQILFSSGSGREGQS